MALATIQDLIALGALRYDENGGDAESARATRLLEFASAAVCLHFGVEEADILTWTDTEQTQVAAVVAECAAQRITSPAGAMAQQLADGSTMWTKTFLTPAMKRALNQIRRGGRGSASVEVSFPSSSPVEWDNWPGYSGLPHDENSFS